MPTFIQFSHIFTAGAIGLSLMSCGPKASTQQADATSADSATTAKAMTCTVDFPMKNHYHEQKVDGKTSRVYSVYAENFSENDLCWDKVKAQVTQVAQHEPGGTTEVYVFDCPGHFPALKVDSTTLGDDYQMHCIAKLQMDHKGQQTFTPKPFFQKSS
jgi:pyruvate carboxylase